MQSHWRNNLKIRSRKWAITIKIQKPKSDVGKSKITIKIQHPKSDYDVHKIKIQQPWSGKCFDDELTSSTRHSISQYIVIYAISKGHRTPCTAIRREQYHHYAIILPDRDRDVISFCIYSYLPSLDRFFFSFLKIWEIKTFRLSALFNSEIGAVPTTLEHLAGMPIPPVCCIFEWLPFPIFLLDPGENKELLNAYHMGNLIVGCLISSRIN